MEIVHCTDYAAATVAMRKRIDMPQKKSTITMSNQFHFDFVRFERFDAKPFGDKGQEVCHFGA
jgi:hypothetical protein